jgi:hypothetical protein
MVCFPQHARLFFLLFFIFGVFVFVLLLCVDSLLLYFWLQEVVTFEIKKKGHVMRFGFKFALALVALVAVAAAYSDPKESKPTQGSA